MENASKALLIAGAILVAIMIISLGVYIFNQYSENVKESADLTEQEIAEFNSKITPYLGNSISGSQVNAMLSTCFSLNLASINEGTIDDKEIKVTLNGSTILDKTYNTYTKVTTGKYYKVVGTYSTSGLIKEITVTLNS